MVAVTMEWESRLGSRLRVRDLYILSTVVKLGSMAKAARQLGITQPGVSEAISSLEHVLRVRLLDRGPRGIEPTIYADAMLKRSTTVFDELRQGVRDIEFLADPTSGSLSIGYANIIADTILPKILERFSEQYPRVAARVELVPYPHTRALPVLRDRTFDLLLVRIPPQTADDAPTDDLNMEALFDDPLVIAAGINSRWARRRKVELAELLNERWILSSPTNWAYDTLANAFKARGLDMPAASLVSSSVDIRANMLASGHFITVLPESMLRRNGYRHPLKRLPVDLPARPWPVTAVTLKNRTLSPVVERFIDCAREISKSLSKKQR